MVRAAAFLLGCFFCLGGLMALAATQGWIPSEQIMNRTTVVFTVLGAVLFTAAGLGMVLWGFGQTTWAASVGMVAALAFVLAFNWIAFGPGERQFTHSVSASSATASIESAQQVSETEGRVIFGLFSLALDGLALLAVAAWWRRRR